MPEYTNDDFHTEAFRGYETESTNAENYRQDEFINNR